MFTDEITFTVIVITLYPFVLSKYEVLATVFLLTTILHPPPPPLPIVCLACLDEFKQMQTSVLLLSEKIEILQEEKVSETYEVNTVRCKANINK